MAWSVDRLGRSLRDLVMFLDDLQSAGVDLFLLQQALDTTTPAGKALFGMMSVFSEFEREMIRSRVMAGLERAKAKGTRLGRPRISQHTEDKIKAMRATGMGMNAISKALGVGSSQVQRVLRAQS